MYTRIKNIAVAANKKSDGDLKTFGFIFLCVTITAILFFSDNMMFNMNINENEAIIHHIIKNTIMVIANGMIIAMVMLLLFAVRDMAQDFIEWVKGIFKSVTEAAQEEFEIEPDTRSKSKIKFPN